MIIAVWKPKGPSSNQLLTQIKRLINIKKVGHAGTLDPLASGILVVAIGRQSTKLLSTEVKKEKEYLAKIKLGETSTTDDAEGQKTKWDVKKIPTLKDIKSTVKQFIGQIEQTPPIFSAIKISGKESYKLARKGEPVKLKPRPVLIKNIEILNFEYPFLEIKVTTGPGVYIRSLARDIGEKLNTGGFIAELERIRVGEFTKEKITSLEDLPALI